MKISNYHFFSFLSPVTSSEEEAASYLVSTNEVEGKESSRRGSRIDKEQERYAHDDVLVGQGN